MVHPYDFIREELIPLGYEQGTVKTNILVRSFRNIQTVKAFQSFDFEVVLIFTLKFLDQLAKFGFLIRWEGLSEGTKSFEILQIHRPNYKFEHYLSENGQNVRNGHHKD